MFIFNPFSTNNDESKIYQRNKFLLFFSKSKKVLIVLCRYCAEEVSFEW